MSALTKQFERWWNWSKIFEFVIRYLFTVIRECMFVPAPLWHAFRGQWPAVRCSGLSDLSLVTRPLTSGSSSFVLSSFRVFLICFSVLLFDSVFCLLSSVFF